MAYVWQPDDNWQQQQQTCTSSATGGGLYWPDWQPTGSITATPIYWPVWQTRRLLIITNNQTPGTTPTITVTRNVYWPEWHDNIQTAEEAILSPAIIKEKIDTALEQYRREQAEKLEECRRVEAAERQEKLRIASEKAKSILLEHLTPDQRDMVEKNGWFVIEGGKSGKRYRIGTKGVAGNVEELDGEKVVAVYCCHLPHQYPAPDHHLTQKLILEWDEEEFLRRANKRDVSGSMTRGLFA